MNHSLPILNPPNPQRAAAPRVVVIGKESVGKSQLIASLTGERPEVSNLKGTTLACAAYRWGERTLIDTPGIERQSDSVTTRDALQSLAEHDTVILVAAGTHLDDDLKDLWPLVAGKQGVVVVTFIDRVANVAASERLEELSRHAGVSFVGVDARAVSAEQTERLRIALTEPAEFSKQSPTLTTGWRVEPPAGWLDRPRLGPVLALSLLMGPATFAVWFANTVAQLLDPIIGGWLKPLAEAIQAWPASLDLLKARSCGPFFFREQEDLGRGHRVALHETLVDRHAQARSIGYFDHPVLHSELFKRHLVQQRVGPQRVLQNPAGGRSRTDMQACRKSECAGPQVRG